jgi:chorismate synthase
MPGNSFGKLFKVTTWGESHGKALGVVIDGCPAGVSLNEKDVQKDVDRRKPRTGSKISTSRNEPDKVEILSGVFEGKTTGGPVSMIVWNKNVRSKDYDSIQNVFRPGHADFTYDAKYRKMHDYRGSGRASGRETVSRVMAGTVAKKLLSKYKTKIVGHTIQIGPHIAKKFTQSEIERNEIRCADTVVAKKMINYIHEIRKEGDSVGGIVEIRVKNCQIGLGDPVFDKLDADIAKALMSIGAVKGVSFGAGFKVAEMKGSENNDPFVKEKGGKVKTLTNNAGGVLGGLASGEDLIINIAVKPTPSISKKQKTINISGKSVEIKIQGRHDACIVPRLIPVAESMIAITLADHQLRQHAIDY